MLPDPKNDIHLITPITCITALGTSGGRLIETHPFLQNIGLLAVLRVPLGAMLVNNSWNNG